MSSPFPGMDPYLEDPLLWPSFHDRFIHVIARELNDHLPSGYFAEFNERVYISEPYRSVLPDVAILEKRPAQAFPSCKGESKTALLEVTREADVPFQITLSDPVREPYVEIMSLREGNRVVTAIELLSPANKAPGAGRNQYRAKQRQTLDSDTHLMEIDLLRQGEPIIIPPPELLRQYSVYDYVVSLHRAQKGFSFDVWLFTLRQRLPAVSVPLSMDDSDVTLNLQTVFHRSYEDGPYNRRVDYGLDPLPSLNRADAEWADALLRDQRLRSM